MMPAPASAASAVGGKPKTAARLPVISAAMKNSGKPIGTVIAMPWVIEPVSTARRTLALLKANEAADKSARKAPSTKVSRSRPMPVEERPRPIRQWEHRLHELRAHGQRER